MLIRRLVAAMMTNFPVAGDFAGPVASCEFERVFVERRIAKARNANDTGARSQVVHLRFAMVQIRTTYTEAAIWFHAG